MARPEGFADDEASYSKLEFNYRIQSRLAAFGAARLCQPVLDELGAIKAAYDVAGSQLRPELQTQPPVTKQILHEWALERGGIVRLSAPRVFLARDPDEAFQSVYKRYVRGVAQVSEGRHLTPEVERSLLRDRFVRALKHLGNFDTDRVRVGTAVQGEKAHHWLDIAIVGHGIPTAFAHAIPLQATDDRLAFMHRGLVLEAAGDMPRQVPKLALYDDPPDSRRGLFDETRTLLDAANVEMVSLASQEAAAARFDAALWQAGS